MKTRAEILALIEELYKLAKKYPENYGIVNGCFIATKTLSYVLSLEDKKSIFDAIKENDTNDKI